MSGSGPQTASASDSVVVVINGWPPEPISSPRIGRAANECGAGAAGWLPLRNGLLLFFVVADNEAALQALAWLRAAEIDDDGSPAVLFASLHGKSRFFAHTASGLMSDPKASYKIYAQEPDISAYRLFAEAEGDPGRGDVARDQGVDKTTEALTSMSISRQDVPATPAPNVPRERHFGPHSDKPRPANAGPRYHQHRGTGLGPLDGDFEPRFDGKVSFSVNQKDPFRLSSADRYNLRNLLPDDPDKQFLTEDGVRRFVGSFVEDWSGVEEVVARPAYATEGTDLDIYFSHSVHFRRFDGGKGRHGRNETIRRNWGTFRAPGPANNIKLFPHPPSSSYRLGSGWPSPSQQLG